MATLPASHDRYACNLKGTAIYARDQHKHWLAQCDTAFGRGDWDDHAICAAKAQAYSDVVAHITGRRSIEEQCVIIASM